jgi:PST family polysaccharide transporter
VLGIKVVGAVFSQSDKLIVGGRLGPEDLGLYIVAFRLPELCIDTVHWIFSSVAFSLYSKVRAQAPEAFRNAMLRALRLTTLFGFSAGTGLAIIAPVAVPVLFSDTWNRPSGRRSSSPSPLAWRRSALPRATSSRRSGVPPRCCA